MLTLSGGGLSQGWANELLSKEGSVLSARQASQWQPANVGQRFAEEERLRTERASRATVELTDRSIIRVNELTTLTFSETQKQDGKKAGLNLLKGMTYFFSREKPETVEVRTPVVSGAIRGTEFHLAVVANGATQLALFDGEVFLKNEQGSLQLGSGEIAEVVPGQAPTKSPMIEGLSIIQWCLYYPAVVSLQDLSLSEAEQSSLSSSLAAYRRGNLLKALEQLPEGSNAAPAYRAALLASVGKVEEAEEILRASGASGPAARALRMMIAAVLDEAGVTGQAGTTASEQLALSYLLQARFDLEGALEAALRSAEADEDFGFALARVAELEFAFGRNREAMEFLDRALEAGPENAQALAVRGFILAGRLERREAFEAFNEAIRLDPALGNAWLGRGLTRISGGEKEIGRRDLQVAATLEPSRSILRSYLAKAFSNEGDLETAKKEIRMAGQLDPNDPTVPLYRGLIEQKENRLNDAVRSIEASQELNENRKLYRSRLLLDQDQAVRRANLARIYQNAGLEDRAVREAIDAVEDDYTNFSSHLFLANTFDSLRDPNGINQRFETAWFNELLLANLFAPVGAGTLSPFVSQQEYSRLFEGDRFSVLSLTNYRSDGIFSQQVDHSGVVGKISYSLSGGYYQSDTRFPNNEFTTASFTGTFKAQLSEQDSLLFLVGVEDAERGDVRRFYDPSATNPDLSFDEEIQPNLILGYNRRWAPGHHTLAVASRLVNDQFVQDFAQPQFVVSREADNTVNFVDTVNFPFDVETENDFEVYSMEVQQVAEYEWHRWIAGGLFQTGTFHASDSLTNPTSPFPQVQPPTTLPVSSSIDEGLTRVKGYLYLTLEPVPQLSLTGGVAVDYLRAPENYRRVPISDGQIERTDVLPKAAVQWEPSSGYKFRGVYAQTRSGVSFEESVRLEPVQLAGFNQAFRTVIPESEINAVEAAEFDLFGIAGDFRLPWDLYLGITAQRIESDVDQSLGAFDVFSPLPSPLVASEFPLNYEYQEDLLEVDLSKLIGQMFSVGLNYQLSHSQLKFVLPESPGSNLTQEADLHRLRGGVLFNHPSGFYAGMETIWYWQNSDGYGGTRPSDQFQHLNVILGYRFWENRGDLRVGFLNLTDDDYRLNPLSVYDSTLPRERAFSVSMRFEY
ncbi:MAG: FecR domain-containing protein [Verrucomicrobiota bacterium]